MHNFYISPEHISSQKVIITGDEKHHLSNVLRLSVDDKIRVLDGCGNVYLSVLTEINDEEAIAKILEHKNFPEPSFRVTLVHGLPKFKKMDLVIQKCTELGVDEFFPVISKRTVPKLSKKSARKRVQRWRKISVEACKQSGRTHFPEVHSITEFDKWYEEGLKSELNLIFWTGEKEQRLRKILKSNIQALSASLLIGPEGGFTDYEIDRCIQLGAIPVSLGYNILRTETASIAGSALLLYEFGRLG